MCTSPQGGSGAGQPCHLLFAVLLGAAACGRFLLRAGQGLILVSHGVFSIHDIMPARGGAMTAVRPC